MVHCTQPLDMMIQFTKPINSQRCRYRLLCSSKVVVSALQANTISVKHGVDFDKCSPNQLYFPTRQVYSYYYQDFIFLRNSLAFIKLEYVRCSMQVSTCAE